MFDAALRTRTAEDVLEGETVPSAIRELNAVVGQCSVEPAGNSFDEILQKLGCLQFPLCIQPSWIGHLSGPQYNLSSVVITRSALFQA